MKGPAAFGAALFLLCLVSSAAAEGTCPFRKKKCSAGSSVSTGGSRSVNYQTAESIKKKYKLDDKKSGKSGLSSKDGKVQTAEDVLDEIERSKKDKMKDAPGANVTASSGTSIRTKGPGTKSAQSSAKKVQSSKQTKATVSAGAPDELQTLLGNQQGYTIDLSAKPSDQSASAK